LKICSRTNSGCPLVKHIQSRFKKLRPAMGNKRQLC
jgi:hypothetical protein